MHYVTNTASNIQKRSATTFLNLGLQEAMGLPFYIRLVHRNLLQAVQQQTIYAQLNSNVLVHHLSGSMSHER